MCLQTQYTLWCYPKPEFRVSDIFKAIRTPVLPTPNIQKSAVSPIAPLRLFGGQDILNNTREFFIHLAIKDIHLQATFCNPAEKKFSLKITRQAQIQARWHENKHQSFKGTYETDLQWNCKRWQYWNCRGTSLSWLSTSFYWMLAREKLGTPSQAVFYSPQLSEQHFFRPENRHEVAWRLVAYLDSRSSNQMF